MPCHYLNSISFESIGRGTIGLAFLVGILWLFSENKRAVDWKLILKGLLLQFILALLIFKVPIVQHLFEQAGKFFLKVISFANFGIEFLIKSFDSGLVESPLKNFLFIILPTLIYFSALTSLLYFLGILQKIVQAFAWLMRFFMRISGAEALSAAGNIFLGQTEAPLLVKPYLHSMNRSEIMCLMTGGMATIAGGVLASYVKFLGGNDPAEQLFYAKHLLAASVMNAPAAIIAAKLLVPQTADVSDKLIISEEKIGRNALEAIANGTTDGIKLAVNVAGMLLVFIALIYLGNFLLGDIVGKYTGLNGLIKEYTSYDKLSFQMILGVIGAPIVWLIGVPSEDILLVGQLLGEKTILNEFYAYVSLGSMKAQNIFVHKKSLVMATYVLCGFANFASIGIQIGGIGSLAPNQRTLLSQLGFKALLGGTVASLLTAVIAGMLI